MTLLQQFQKLVAASKAKDPDKLRVQELDSRVRQQAVEHLRLMLGYVELSVRLATTVALRLNGKEQMKRSSANTRI